MTNNLKELLARMMQLGPETVIQLATHLIMKKRTLSIKHFKTTTGSLKI